MRKFIIPAMLIATMALSACASNEQNVTTTEAATETVTETTADMAEETEAETPETQLESVITETATYIGGDEYGENQLLFENAEGGQFICNISGLTDMTVDLQEGTEYMISHSPIMTMSLPGILPQVYGIREADTEMVDTMARLDEINMEATELLFTADDGTQFYADMIVPDYEIGKTYIVTHDGTMTRSLPGKYLNVTRIIDLEQTLNA